MYANRRGLGAGAVGKFLIVRDPVELVSDGDPLTGAAVMGVGVGTPRNAPHLNGPSMFGTVRRTVAPPTTAIALYDDPILDAPPASTGGTPPAINSGILGVAPPATVSASDSGFSFSSIPWWGWAAGAGGLLFMFGGKR